MHDAGSPLRRHVRREAAVHLIHGRDIPALGLLELGVPAAQLALDVARLAAEVAEPDGVGVDGMQLHEHVDERPARLRARRLVEMALGVLRVVEDEALDEVHHVEGRVVDRGVLAEGQRLRHGH